MPATGWNYYNDTDDSMDIDEQIRQDVASLRASKDWIATPQADFETTNISNRRVHFFVVIDTNVLISYLALIHDLIQAVIRQPSCEIAFCLPKVVVAELNSLKERGSPSIRALAQEANIWLLTEVRSRSGFVRGQQANERMSTENQRINDDQIVDYCEYLWSQADKRQGAVILLSNDQNCCLKCELQGIPTISPTSSSTAASLLPRIVNGTVTLDYSTNSSIWASPTNSHPRRHGGTPSSYSSTKHLTSRGDSQMVSKGPSVMDSSMDLDDDYVSPSATHPLSMLHTQFLEYLGSILPHLAYEVALAEQARRGSESPAAPEPSSSLFESIHAPKSSNAKFLMPSKVFSMPDQNAIQEWSCLECIEYSIKFPPPPIVKPTPSIIKLRLFLLVHNQPGGRWGKEWAQGDWELALRELDNVSDFCNWIPVKEAVRICRDQLAALLHTA